MRILVCGANGFIGGTIAAHLAAAGHTVVRGVRHPAEPGDIAIDYARDFEVADWLPRLQGIDAVVNAIGIIIEQGGQKFDDIHRRAPSAMFAACAEAGVKRVLQISALGAERGDTAYFATKRAADEVLMAQPVEWQIVRPAIVYGADGASAKVFRMLASLPLISLPAGGHQRLQPVHVDDLAAAVIKLLDPMTPPRQCMELVGGAELQYRDMLRAYRKAMLFPPAWEIPVPSALVSIMANTLGRLPGVMLTPDTWKMLRAGSFGSTTAITQLLGHAPRGIEQFIPPTEAMPLRQEVLAAWRTPLLRVTLAVVWIVSGVVSACVYPRARSLQLLAQVGLVGSLAWVALYGAALLDIVLGVLSVLRPGRLLWLAQIALIVVYTVIIALALPAYLIHPFGPVLKNLPMLVILFILLAEDR